MAVAATGFFEFGGPNSSVAVCNVKGASVGGESVAPDGRHTKATFFARPRIFWNCGHPQVARVFSGASVPGEGRPLPLPSDLLANFGRVASDGAALFPRRGPADSLALMTLAALRFPDL